MRFFLVTNSVDLNFCLQLLLIHLCSLSLLRYMSIVLLIFVAMTNVGSCCFDVDYLPNLFP